MAILGVMTSVAWIIALVGLAATVLRRCVGLLSAALDLREKWRKLR
jgi:hypothetical protein